MAGRGLRNFARRILHAIAPVIPGPGRSRPSPAPTPSPETPREPEQFKGGQKRRKDPYRDAWGNLGRGYRRAKELFDTSPGMSEPDLPEADKLELWNVFLDNIISGHSLRKSPQNPFWRASGIHPDSFDWDEFKQIMKQRGS